MFFHAIARLEFRARKYIFFKLIRLPLFIERIFKELEFQVNQTRQPALESPKKKDVSICSKHVCAIQFIGGGLRELVLHPNGMRAIGGHTSATRSRDIRQVDQEHGRWWC